MSFLGCCDWLTALSSVLRLQQRRHPRPSIAKSGQTWLEGKCKIVILPCSLTFVPDGTCRTPPVAAAVQVPLINTSGHQANL